MYAFQYHRPQSVADAAKLLAASGEAKLLAGGHTLLPTMKLRLAKPEVIVDLSPGGRAQGHREEGQRARHRRHDHARRGGDLGRSCAARSPASCEVAAGIGDRT